MWTTIYKIKLTWLTLFDIAKAATHGFSQKRESPGKCNKLEWRRKLPPPWKLFRHYHSHSNSHKSVKNTCAPELKHRAIIWGKLPANESRVGIYVYHSYCGCVPSGSWLQNLCTLQHCGITNTQWNTMPGDHSWKNVMCVKRRDGLLQSQPVSALISQVSNLKKQWLIHQALAGSPE